MSGSTIKDEMAVLYASSLRDLVKQVNAINTKTNGSILKEDIVTITKDDDGIYFLIYYR